MDVIIKAIAESRYDVLEEFFTKLSAKLSEDSKNDESKGRTRLSVHLKDASRYIAEASEEIGIAWDICKKQERKNDAIV